MNTGDYLARIGYRGHREPSAAVLTSLHRAHLLSVPFENLDIPLGHRIELDPAAFYDKIVRRRRGGFCYELNGLFAWLLERLGFGVTLLSGRVYNGGRPGPEFDHMVLRVETTGAMLADVGFGDSFIEPLRLIPGEQVQQGVAYRLTGPDGARILERLGQEDRFEPQYSFSATPRRLEEFAGMCRYQQTSPDSTFTRKSVCSVATEDGRVTLANGRLIVTSRGQRLDRRVESEEEYRSSLNSRFGIVLGRDEPIGRLLLPPSG